MSGEQCRVSTANYVRDMWSAGQGHRTLDALVCFWAGLLPDAVRASAVKAASLRGISGALWRKGSSWKELTCVVFAGSVNRLFCLER